MNYCGHYCALPFLGVISSIDGIIVIGYLLIVLAVGLWSGRHQTGLEDFFLAKKSIPWWVLMVSIVATETSVATFLSIPGLSYAEGGNLTFLQIALGYVLGRIVVAKFLLPYFFAHAHFSAYEVLEKRLGVSIRHLASFLFLVTRTIADGLRLFLTALVLHEALNWSPGVSILATGGVTLLFTTGGGARSVIWNDFIQFVVYILGALISAYYLLTIPSSGIDGFLEFGSQFDKFAFLDFDFSIFKKTITFWAGLIGGAILTMATHGADQMMVQRYLAAGTLSEARKAVVTSGVVVFLQFALFLLIGVGLANYYLLFPPATPFESNDKVFTRFIVDVVPTGVTGIVIAAVLSAAISTSSSSLNSSAGALVNDFLRVFWPNTSDSKLLFWSKAATVLFGCLQMLVAWICVKSHVEKSIVDLVLKIAGFSTSILLGLLLLSMSPKAISSSAAIVGLLIGLSVLSWIGIKTDLHWAWYTAIGTSTVFLSALLINVGFPPSESTLERQP